MHDIGLPPHPNLPLHRGGLKKGILRLGLRMAEKQTPLFLRGKGKVKD